jgi:hypothetical protein
MVMLPVSGACGVMMVISFIPLVLSGCAAGEFLPLGEGIPEGEIQRKKKMKIFLDQNGGMGFFLGSGVRSRCVLPGQAYKNLALSFEGGGITFCPGVKISNPAAFKRRGIFVFMKKSCSYCGMEESESVGMVKARSRERLEIHSGRKIGVICGGCFNHLVKSINRSVVAETSGSVKKVLKSILLVKIKPDGECIDAATSALIYANQKERALDVETEFLLERIKQLQSEVAEIRKLKVQVQRHVSQAIYKTYEHRRKVADAEIKNDRLRIIVFSKDNFRCVSCGSEENLSVDHIRPVLKGGSSEINNLQTLCKSCNSRKGAK